MELIITKNNHIYARATDENMLPDDIYELKTVETLPDYPIEKAGKGKYWELDYVDNALTWVLKDRPLTTEERMAQLESDMETIKYEWRAGEVVVGINNDGVPRSRRFFNGVWYLCIQSHTTQADWTPDTATSLWERE